MDQSVLTLLIIVACIVGICLLPFIIALIIEALPIAVAIVIALTVYHWLAS